MELRNLGASGLRVSLVGLGCNNFGQRIDLESSRAVIHKALDAGITLFDTADTYGGRGGSETVMGQILGDRRKDIVLASKFGMPMDDGEKKGASRRYMMAAVEASLKRLKTDWLDLYQVHQPDPLTPIEETLRGARRPRARRQGALRRLLELLRRADDRGAMGRAAPQPQRLRLGAGRIQPAQARPRRRKPRRDASATGSACCRISRSPPACSPASTSAARAAAGSRLATRAVRRTVHDRREFRHRREARSLREGARPHDAGAGVLLARRAPDRSAASSRARPSRSRSRRT